MKPYNLLDERWIPVVRASGSRDWIRPCDVCVADDPVVRIATGRPDFDGSLLQFLVGLLQTAAAPESESDWRAWYGSPPSSSELHHRFDPHRDAFNLTGDGPLFMQDTELEPGDSSLGIERLLIDAAGDNTVRHNADLFIKRERVEALSLPAAAAALFTLQANAPSGGQGHRTSLRGGGPMTTLVVGEGLWKTTWLNVLNQRSFRDVPGETRLADLKARYPWMGPTKTSAHDEQVLPSERHPATHYWAMPRRIRLAAACEGICGILRGEPSSLVVARYATEPRGENYGGAWLHPLTPYARAKPADLPNPKKPQPGGIAYKDWPHVALGDGELRSPARVVWQYFAGERYDLARADRLWAFGYDMDNISLHRVPHARGAEPRCRRAPGGKHRRSPRTWG